MKRGSTMVLKGVVAMIGLFVLFVCGYVLPKLLISELTTSDFDFGWLFIGVYVSAVPFMIALYQAFKLLKYIELGQAFSQRSVAALKKTKCSAAAISALYVAGMPYIFYLAGRDDAPGLAAIGFVIIFAAFVIAVAAAVFENLFQSAVDIKNENDLTA